jgi:hypothetical protein
MPIDTRWLVPHTVLFNDLSGLITLAEVADMISRSTAILAAEGDDTGVYIFVNIGSDVWYASDILNLKALRLVSHVSDKMTALVIIDAKPHPVAAFVAYSIMKLMGVSYYSCKTFAGAVTLVEQLRPSIVFTAHDA